VDRAEIDTPNDLYRFWRQESPDGNRFSTPSNSPRSETILRIIAPYVTPGASVLEIGCNVGRNLNHLWHSGYRDLRGLEISAHAVRRLREGYPSLRGVPVDIGPADRVLPSYSDAAFDLVFTMAALEHIHPDHRDVFAEISRIARRHVLTIEPRAREGHASHRQYPWDARGELESNGLRLVETKVWTALWPTSPTAPDSHWCRDFDGYDAMLFEVSAET